jgi:hypothetical protein
MACPCRFRLAGRRASNRPGPIRNPHLFSQENSDSIGQDCCLSFHNKHSAMFVCDSEKCSKNKWIIRVCRERRDVAAGLVFPADVERGARHHLHQPVCRCEPSRQLFDLGVTLRFVQNYTLTPAPRSSCSTPGCALHSNPERRIRLAASIQMTQSVGMTCEIDPDTDLAWCRAGAKRFFDAAGNPIEARKVSHAGASLGYTPMRL